MIRTWSPLYKSLKSCSIQEVLKYKRNNNLILCRNSWTENLYKFSVDSRFYSTVSITQSTEFSMSSFKLLDYDCIGFDLDNTLLRYNVTNLAHLVYEILADYLIKEKGYDSKYLSLPLEDKDLDFMQKGLLLDSERGNILRINADGIIQRACHGTNLLSIENIKEIYPGQRWEVTDAFCYDMLSTWNGPMSMQLRSLLDYFDVSTALIFARLIDTLDDQHGGPLNSYNVWPDMLEGLVEMYNKDHFKLDKGQFFPALKTSPEKYMYKCTTRTISWLKELRKHRVTFLLTGSNADFVNFTASYALGEDWKSLFDINICFAKKPGFFTENRPFLQVNNFEEGAAIESKDLKRGEIYSQGNWKGLTEFLGYMSEKENPRCLYVGDNLVQDIYAPNSFVQCDTITVSEEQMSEGMVHQKLSHQDEKVLNSTFWGSYFCLKDSTINKDSLWGHVIKKYSIRIIPAIKEQLQQLLRPKKDFESSKNIWRMKRIEQKQQEGLAAVKKILEDRKEAELTFLKI
ncbi:5'-nucleotidase domain-containing protein 1 isoform X2 [Ceratina calcarata]|uniref:5'-nucleotidase domain-containing protein 1 n=1 Tax=Ceratina calcarata TaxID=156304 RepID=A0AAJ7S5W5_9HYME|nr:5'-nucleotidase domain-containing protein 1 isoform X2 [Ceratina calcarata]